MSSNSMFCDNIYMHECHISLENVITEHRITSPQIELFDEVYLLKTHQHHIKMCCFGYFNTFSNLFSNSSLAW